MEKKRKRDKEKLSIVKSIVVGQKYRRGGGKDKGEIDCAVYIKNKSNLFGASWLRLVPSQGVLGHDRSADHSSTTASATVVRDASTLSEHGCTANFTHGSSGDGRGTSVQLLALPVTAGNVEHNSGVSGGTSSSSDTDADRAGANIVAGACTAITGVGSAVIVATSRVSASSCARGAGRSCAGRLLSNKWNVSVEHGEQVHNRFLVICWCVIGCVWLLVQVGRWEESESVQSVELVGGDEELDEGRVVAEGCFSIVRTKPVVDDFACGVIKSIRNTNRSIVVDLISPVG